MSQPLESKTISALDQVSNLDADTLVESYADELMDSLFEDMDRLLEGDEKAIDSALNPPIKPESLPQEATPARSTSIVPLDAALDISLPEALPHPEPSEAPPTRERSWFSRHLLKLLIGAAIVGTSGLVGLWFAYQRLIPEASPNSTTTNLPSQADAEFMQYLQRSLEVINTQAAETAASAAAPASDLPQVTVLPGGQGPNNPVPGSPVPAQPIPGKAGQINVIERVYVPYQPPQTAAPTSTAPTATVPRPQSSGNQTPAQAAAPTQVAVNHTLMGILELGDRSAALFEIDGIAQRVSLGGRIGESGWTLVSVSNEEAIIRRNGEVRSIYIGQEF
mgnify:CR=1 FL=1